MTDMSLPSWGVWIEIRMFVLDRLNRPRHSPHGECGLKYVMTSLTYQSKKSLPSWGVWIEIIHDASKGMMNGVTPLMGSVD